MQVWILRKYTWILNQVGQIVSRGFPNIPRDRHITCNKTEDLLIHFQMVKQD